MTATSTHYVSCLTCGQPPGIYCVDGYGFPKMGYHLTRHRAARLVRRAKRRAQRSKSR